MGPIQEVVRQFFFRKLENGCRASLLNASQREPEAFSPSSREPLPAFVLLQEEPLCRLKDEILDEGQLVEHLKRDAVSFEPLPLENWFEKLSAQDSALRAIQAISGWLRPRQVNL